MTSDLYDPPVTLLPFPVTAPPLRVDGGVIRVGNSRISLDLVVEQYNNGMAPEDLVRAYDTLSLLDVHAVIAYYLGHRGEVDAYMVKREEASKGMRETIEAARPRFAPEELLARQKAREQGHATTGE